MAKFELKPEYLPECSQHIAALELVGRSTPLCKMHRWLALPGIGLQMIGSRERPTRHHPRDEIEPDPDHGIFGVIDEEKTDSRIFLPLFRRLADQFTVTLRTIQEFDRQVLFCERLAPDLRSDRHPSRIGAFRHGNPVKMRNAGSDFTCRIH